MTHAKGLYYGAIIGITLAMLISYIIFELQDCMAYCKAQMFSNLTSYGIPIIIISSFLGYLIEWFYKKMHH